MKIAIGNDHAGVALKNHIQRYLEQKGYTVVNFGTDTQDSCDYPRYGKLVADAVVSKDCDLGILICGTGVGISIAANKVKGVRAVVCSEPCSAKLSREHNHANIVAFGARIVGSAMAERIVDSFLSATEDNSPRHRSRIDLITAVENGTL